MDAISRARTIGVEKWPGSFTSLQIRKRSSRRQRRDLAGPWSRTKHCFNLMLPRSLCRALISHRSDATVCTRFASCWGSSVVYISQHSCSDSAVPHPTPCNTVFVVSSYNCSCELGSMWLHAALSYVAYRASGLLLAPWLAPPKHALPWFDDLNTTIGCKMTSSHLNVPRQLEAILVCLLSQPFSNLAEFRDQFVCTETLRSLQRFPSHRHLCPAITPPSQFARSWLFPAFRGSKMHDSRR